MERKAEARRRWHLGPFVTCRSLFAGLWRVRVDALVTDFEKVTLEEETRRARASMKVLKPSS